MKKKTLVLVIALMSISLFGLIAFQVYWIHHGLRLEAEMFDRNVQDALIQVAGKLETQEKIEFLKQEAPQIRNAVLEPSLAEPEQVKKTKTETKAPRKVLNPVAPAPYTKQAQTYVITDKTGSGTSVTSLPRHFSIATEDHLTVSEHPVTRSIPVYGKAAEKTLTYSRSSGNGKNHVVLRPNANDTTSVDFKHVFGNTKADSLIVWKVLGAHARKADSLLGGNKHRVFHRARPDSFAVLRLANDSSQKWKGLDVARKIPVKDIRSVHVKNKIINIYTDTLRILPSGSTISIRALKDTSRQKAFKTGAYEAAPAGGRPYFIKATTPTQQVRQEAPIKRASQKQQAATQKAATAKAEKGLVKVMQQMAVEYVRKEKPLQERLKQLHLNELLNKELKARQILTPFHVTLQQNGTTAATRNVVLTSASVPTGNMNASSGKEYRVRLFPNDILSEPTFLALEFPNRNAYVWESLLLPTSVSVLFTLVMVLTFAFTLYTILRQKKLSEIKNDFINNMTHEFKTPLATISLALDAMVNPKVRKDEGKIDFYARIIKDENKRMNQQVEKVLQTAQMERNDPQLVLEATDVHALIQKAIEPFQLHIAQRQGNLDLKLEAIQPIIQADPGHLGNMIANLLDNANKYSPDALNIVVQTATVANGVHITIADQGIGMTREAQKRVFDKFYRVPTGNVHNVKGFGLGLSYVKTMVEAHAGNIHVRSELGKGSRFTLWLPSQASAMSNRVNIF